MGLWSGSPTEEFPRLAISGAIVRLFASLGMVVYFADHLIHSIQIDAINRRIEKNTRRAIGNLHSRHTEESAPRAPDWAVPLIARKSGYLQTVHPELLLPVATRTGVTICCGCGSVSTSSPERPWAGSGPRRPTTRSRRPSG